MSEDSKEVDVDFNEALRRIAHTPKALIDNKKHEKESAPPVKDDAAKVDKQSHPSK